MKRCNFEVAVSLSQEIIAGGKYLVTALGEKFYDFAYLVKS